jgi:hypothetical protein
MLGLVVGGKGGTMLGRFHLRLPAGLRGFVGPVGEKPRSAMKDMHALDSQRSQRETRRRDPLDDHSGRG